MGVIALIHLPYLADILERIHDHKINRLDELLLWNWSPAASAMSSQAAQAAVSMKRLHFFQSQHIFTTQT